MSRVLYNDFEKGLTKSVNVFEVTLGKILLVEDPKVGGYTAFFKLDKETYVMATPEECIAPPDDFCSPEETFPDCEGCKYYKPNKTIEQIISEGETKEEAVINLLETYNTVLNSGNIKLKTKKILPK
jgi:hypothetical protein